MDQKFECDFAGLTAAQKKAVEMLIDNCQEDFFTGVSPSAACERFRRANALMASNDPATKKRGKDYNRILLELYTTKP